MSKQIKYHHDWQTCSCDLCKDARALHSDWCQVGDDLRVAMGQKPLYSVDLAKGKDSTGLIWLDMKGNIVKTDFYDNSYKERVKEHRVFWKKLIDYSKKYLKEKL